MAADDLMGQDEIEALLNQTKDSSSETPAPAAQAAAPAEDDDKLLAQDDIEKLLAQAGKTGSAPDEAAPAAAAKQPGAVAAPAAAPVAPAASIEEVAQGDVDYLLDQAEKALASINSDAETALPPDVRSFRLEEFGGAPASSETATIDLIRDVELDLKIELGRTHMYLEDVLRLRKGSVVPLDKLAGDPVDIYVNGRLIARGEVLVLNDNFCVRVAELIAGTHSYT